MSSYLAVHVGTSRRAAAKQSENIPSQIPGKKSIHFKGEGDRSGTTSSSYTSDSEQTSINMSEVLDLIRRVSSLANMSHSDLNKKQSADVMKLSDIINVVQDTDDLKIISEAIRAQFKKAAGTIKPGTVGSTFYGCMDPNTKPVGGRIHCSALCAGSVPASWESGDFPACHMGVVNLSNGTLEILHRKGDTAYLHCLDDKWTGLSDDHITQLKTAGISHLTVTKFNPDTGESEPITENASRDTLSRERISRSNASITPMVGNMHHPPPRKQPSKSSNSKPTRDNCDTTEKERSWWPFVIGIIIFIVVLIILGGMCYWWFSSSSAVNVVSPATTCAAPTITKSTCQSALSVDDVDAFDSSYRGGLLF